MLRFGGLCDSLKSPLPPFFEKGGEHLYSGIATIGVLIWLQAFIRSPFDKGGQGDLKKVQSEHISDNYYRVSLTISYIKPRTETHVMFDGSPG